MFSTLPERLRKLSGTLTKVLFISVKEAQEYGTYLLMPTFYSGKKYFADKKYEKALEQFLATVETPENSQGSRRTGDMRSPQINYFTGIAYEALGKKVQAKDCFTFSTEQSVRETNYIRYYQGLSYLKLGQKVKASEIFNSMIEEGNKRIKQGSETDFFAKFGEREAENVQLSNACLLKGLGYKGLGDATQAKENLTRAVELSASNLYARVELNQ